MGLDLEELRILVNYLEDHSLVDHEEEHHNFDHREEDRILVMDDHREEDRNLANHQADHKHHLDLEDVEEEQSQVHFLEDHGLEGMYFLEGILEDHLDCHTLVDQLEDVVEQPFIRFL